MDVAQTQAFYPTCKGHALFQKPGINHRLHFHLTLLTFGFWSLAWIIFSFVDLLNPYRCPRCGETHRSTVTILVFMLLVFILGLSAIVRISSYIFSHG